MNYLHKSILLHAYWPLNDGAINDHLHLAGVSQLFRHQTKVRLLEVSEEIADGLRASDVSIRATFKMRLVFDHATFVKAPVTPHITFLELSNDCFNSDGQTPPSWTADCLINDVLPNLSSLRVLSNASAGRARNGKGDLVRSGRVDTILDLNIWLGCPLDSVGLPQAFQCLELYTEGCQLTRNSLASKLLSLVAPLVVQIDFTMHQSINTGSSQAHRLAKHYGLLAKALNKSSPVDHVSLHGYPAFPQQDIPWLLHFLSYLSLLSLETIHLDINLPVCNRILSSFIHKHHKTIEEVHIHVHNHNYRDPKYIVLYESIEACTVIIEATIKCSPWPTGWVLCTDSNSPVPGTRIDITQSHNWKTFHHYDLDDDQAQASFGNFNPIYDKLWQRGAIAVSSAKHSLLRSS